MLNGTKILFCRPYVGKEEINAVAEVIKNGWITSGPKTQEFEKLFAEYVGAKYAVFVNSCTSAIALSLQYYKKKYGIKKVLVPSLTFAATVTEVVHAGLEPVFGNVAPNMTLDGWFEQSEFDAAIPVHLTGVKADTSYYTVPVIEDSAHLIEKDQCKGNKNAVCFSFYATKNMTTGEGGMIATNDNEMYEWLLQARHHGISKGGWNRYSGGDWKYEIEFVGWKCNQSDIQAAMGIEQLKKLPDMDKKRKKIIEHYNERLGLENKGLHLYPILVRDRDKFMEIMKSAGIQCSVHFLPVHKMKAFNSNKSLPLTNWFGNKLVSLPLYPGLKDEEVDYICDEVIKTKLYIKKGD